MNKLLKGVLGACLVTLPAYASATVYNVSITYDGSSQSLDAGSDAVSGQSLNAGDGFVLDLHAEAHDYWEVNNGGWGIYAAFNVSPAEDRNYDSIATFYLKGQQVHLDTDLDAVQSLVHVGAQVTSPAVGLLFDQIIVDYTYLAGADTTFNSDTLGFSFLGNDNLASYRVPEPATVLMLGLGLAGFAASRKRRAAA